MAINTDKTKEMILYFGKSPHSFGPINMNGNQIEAVSVMKSLGLIFNKDLTWHNHVNQITCFYSCKATLLGGKTL